MRIKPTYYKKKKNSSLSVPIDGDKDHLNTTDYRMRGNPNKIAVGACEWNALKMC